ncbi:MAG TPA: ATP-binding protein [Vicinamibacterales bacterium]|nr:ATP-binding protein [Vicinamibacterales bacterium]
MPSTAPDRAGTFPAGWPAVLDAATDIIVWLDAELRHRYVNAAIEQATGRPVADFIGKTVREVDAHVADVFEAQFRTILATKQPTLFEFDFETPTGARRFQATAAPLTTANGDVDSVIVISRDISDTRALRLLEGAIHHLPTAVALVEAPTGRLLLRNQPATDIFRVESTPLASVSGYSRFIGFHDDGSQYTPEEWPLSRSIMHGEVVDGEIAEIQRGDNTRGFIRMTSAPLRDAQGAVIAGLVTFDDVTAEIEADRRARFLVQATEVLTTTLDRTDVLHRLARLAVPLIADACFVDLNRGANGGDTAVRRVDLPGFRSAIVVPIIGRAGAIAALTFATAASGRTYDERDVAFVDDLARRVGLALDNARLLADARAAEERLRMAAEGASVGLWNFNVSTGELYWDATIRRQFGVSPDETMSYDRFASLVHAEDHARIADAFERAVRDRQPYDVEYRIGSPDAPTWIRALAHAQFTPDGKAHRMDGITIDVTDRKQAADDLAAALATRDDFIAAASHELRNPLNALQLQLVGLRRAAQRDPGSLASSAMSARFERTEEQVVRLIRLVDTLLDVSRIKAGRLDLEYDAIDLVDVARQVVQQFESTGASIRLSCPDAIVGRWDRMRLEQVLLNLISNAVKYGDGQPVDIQLSLADGQARIDVADRGVGIPREMIPRLFARFERLTPDRRRGGFGLGLWITRQIVNAFGGWIDVQSVVGQGSTFTVVLPIA